jgi:hypothetical protein
MPHSPFWEANSGFAIQKITKILQNQLFIIMVTGAATRPQVLECVWNLMAHGNARDGKWRGNWRMEWVPSTLMLPRNVVYPALLTLMRTPRLPVVDWTDAPVDLTGLVRFGERRNLFSARVPSHFKRSLHLAAYLRTIDSCHFFPRPHYSCLFIPANLHVCVRIVQRVRTTQLTSTAQTFMLSIHLSFQATIFRNSVIRPTLTAHSEHHKLVDFKNAV